MSPMNNDDYRLTISGPRASGDEPVGVGVLLGVFGWSPRERG